MEKRLKKLLRKEKGITLVALIITVILMLILAGVAISAVIDGDGLFSKSREATQQYENAAKAENKTISNLMNYIEKYINGSSTTPTGDVTVTISANEITRTAFVLIATGNDINNQITKYEFYINGKLEETVTTSEGIATYSVTGKEKDTLYNCKVKVYNASGKSKESANIAVTPKAIPVKLADQGMVPVVYNSTDSSWYIATQDQIQNDTWYEYVNTSETGKASTSQWANAMLMDNLKVDNDGITTTVTNENLAQLYGKKVTSEGSMYVWVPRYAYQITSNLHNGGSGVVGDINVVFIDKDNKNGSKIYSTIYPQTTDIGTAIGRMNDYVVHPAFTWAKEDGTPVQLEGIWVGKFEASATDGEFIAKQPGNVITTINETTPANSVILRSIGNVSNWRGMNRSNNFLNCYNMNNEANASIYGISTNKDEIDPHLIKNTEWGATTYLAHSKYGRNKIADESMSNTSGYTTGKGNYKTNVNLSTTGNIYGIYDMAGGAWENVAAFVDSTNGGTVTNNYLTGDSYGKDLYEAADKYKDVYIVGTSDNSTENYIANSGKYGDGIYETSKTSSSWNGDYLQYSYSSYPFLCRGGRYANGSNAGVFALSYYNGGAGEDDDGFRSVLTTL